MASTEKAKEQTILPPDAFKYLNSIELLQPEFLDSWKPRSTHDIPPPSHRVMAFQAELEQERILSRINNAYARVPSYAYGCLKELLQWLHRFDFTQDDEQLFNHFLFEILSGRSDSALFDTPILQTQTHEFFLVFNSVLRPMNAAWDKIRGTIDVKNEKLTEYTHEFNPALQVERDSDTEERTLPLRFGLPVGKLVCFEKKKPKKGGHFLLMGYTPFHLVFHPIDKSFWMVVDRYRDTDGEYSMADDLNELEYQTNKALIRALRLRFGRKWDDNVMEAEAFRLGPMDLWFPQGLGLSEREKQARQLDGGVGFDGNESEEPVPRFARRDPPPTIEFSSLPKVSLFRDTDPPQVHFATHTCFQSYLAENGVVKGRSWLSVWPVPN